MSDDANRVVKDIDLSAEDSASCHGANGAIIDVDGDCWQNTHGDQLNVYDFTLWSMEHGGNEPSRGFFPIKDAALSGGAVLHFPSWHPMSRWTSNSGATYKAINVAIARVGDLIMFDDLPRRVQSAGIAQALGVNVTTTHATPGEEMCGSPGEVANDPTAGHHFWYGKERYSNVPVYNQQELLANYRPNEGASVQKSIIHATLALSAPDQLRQRVAWALSQIFVIAEFSSVVLGDNGEVWTLYYDIFVRHAFGNYQDIMWEVSFNPVMAHYLTYMNSESWAYKSSVPDENYAREIMQLFSLGLWILNEDGTRVLGDDGEPIHTYTNEAIVEFAKIWTGFTDRDLRGNMEMKRISQSNQVDPMLIRADRHDAFPKMDLYKGHIGDTYPLCVDLPPRAFLRVGAKYRYLGATGVPDLQHGGTYEFGASPNAHEPLFEPDPAGSMLYSSLCDADPSSGQCKFKSTLILKTNLICHGLECTVETVRVVRIMSGGTAFYYEYVPVPCVALTFFESGRFIDNVIAHRDDPVAERLCADPRARVARPGCCSAKSKQCFEYPCKYVDERMTFASALKRCDEVYWPPPPPPPTGDEACPKRATKPGGIGGWGGTCTCPDGLVYQAGDAGSQRIACFGGGVPGEFSKTNPGGAGVSVNCSTPCAVEEERGRWGLHPALYANAVAGCPDGSAFADEHRCLAAAMAAFEHGGEPHFDEPLGYRLYTLDDANAPAGCIVRVGSARVYYNAAKGGVGKPNKDYKIVCNTTKGAAEFKGASPVLCTRKRSRCWWKDEGKANCNADFRYGVFPTLNPYFWTEEKCNLQAQVNVDGRVSVVHPRPFPGSESIRSVEVNSENWFLVRWNEGSYPHAVSNCGDASCTIVAGESGDTCVCDVKVTTKAVWTDATVLPTQGELEETLHIGASPPERFGPGEYTVCETASCLGRSPSVRLYTRGTAADPILDESAIFVIRVNATNSSSKGRTLYLANKQSTVALVGNTALSFRNPPRFMSVVDPSQRDALYEVQALLDHLFYHQNVAPFVAKSLIQRLVTSNPSPRYVAVVAHAFRTGEYAETVFSGSYGDLGAAVAAALLDREARSLLLAADPSHGQIREPFLRLLHYMRTLEYTTHHHRELHLDRDLISKIGQAAYRAPTVFSFFLPSYAPEGAVLASGLVAPEAMLGVLPFVIGYIDGMSALVFDGLSDCQGGFGSRCVSRNSNVEPWSTLYNDGYLAFTPTNATSATDVIDELDLLLTGGRLDGYSRGVITSEYQRALNDSSCPIDRSKDLCGRLTPGQALLPGEHITNANGEVLCVTYDGVARHIAQDGREVFNTAYSSRGTRSALEYDAQTHRLHIQGIRPNGRPEKWRWSSHEYAPGAMDAFHGFLAGGCIRHDRAAYARRTLYDYATTGANTTTALCDAKSTCGLPKHTLPMTASQRMERAKSDSSYAVRVALNLFAASSAFVTTNYPGTTNGEVEPPAFRAFNAKPYKALVVLFMAGGADTFNLLVPHSNCDSRNASGAYVATRSNVGVPLDQALPIDVEPGTQPCNTFGLHPEHRMLESLWRDGDVSFMANVGALVEPMTKQEYVDKEARLPAGVFAHNLQTQGAKTLLPQTTTGSSGIVGRIFRAFDAQAAAKGTPPIKGSAYSITSDRTIFRGSPIEPVLLSSFDGMLTYEGSQSAINAVNAVERNASMEAFAKLSKRETTSIFAEAHNTALRSSLRESERISKLLGNASLTQDWNQAVGRASATGKRFVAQFEQVSSVIASRRAFEAERDVFYVELGGFDHHSGVTAELTTKFGDINVALEAFVAEMK